MAEGGVSWEIAKMAYFERHSQSKELPGVFGAAQRKLDEARTADEKRMARSDLLMLAMDGERYGANKVIEREIKIAVAGLSPAEKLNPDSVLDAIIGRSDAADLAVRRASMTNGGDVATGYGATEMILRAGEAYTLLTQCEFQSDNPADSLPPQLLEMGTVTAPLVESKAKLKGGEPVIDWGQILAPGTSEGQLLTRLAYVRTMDREEIVYWGRELTSTIEDVNKMSFSRVQELILASDKPASDPNTARLLDRRQALLTQAQVAGALDQAQTTLVSTLRSKETDWDNYGRQIEGVAQETERVAKTLRGYVGKPELDGIAAAAVRGTALLVQLDGWLNMSSDQCLKFGVTESAINNLRTRIKKETFWRPTNVNFVALVEANRISQDKLGSELLRPNPDAVEKQLISRLLDGKWIGDEIGVREKIAALAGYRETESVARKLQAMANLLSDIEIKDGDPRPSAQIGLTAENLFNLENEKQVMVILKRLMEVVGFKFGQPPKAGKDIWDEWERLGASSFFGRDKILGEGFGRLKDKNFWDLRNADMLDQNGNKGFVSLLADMFRGDRKAVAIAIGLLRHSRVLEMVAMDSAMSDHPLVDASWYGLMHPAEYLRIRAVKIHPVANEAPLGVYIRMNSQDFPLRDNEGNYPKTSETIVPGTRHTWTELMLPQDWLRSWFFARDVMSGGNTMWDLVATATPPRLEDFNEKGLWEIEKFRRKAAESINEILFKKATPIATGEGKPWADEIASKTRDIAGLMGVATKYEAMGRSDLEIEKIRRIFRAIVISRLGMSQDRGRLNIFEDKAYVVAAGMKDLKSTAKFIDAGTDYSLVLALEDADFSKWVRLSGLPLRSLGEQKVLAWIKDDPEGLEVMKIWAQDLKDEGSRVKVFNFLNRREKGGVKIGGFGRRNGKQSFEADLWQSNQPGEFLNNAGKMRGNF